VYSEKVMREREQHFRKWSRVPKCSKENPRWQLHRSARHIKNGWDLSTSGDLIIGNRLVTWTLPIHKNKEVEIVIREWMLMQEPNSRSDYILNPRQR
jgi:hypothetical protein